MKKNYLLLCISLFVSALWTSLRAADGLPLTESQPTVEQDFNSMWDATASAATLAMPAGWRIDRQMDAPRTLNSFASAATTVMYSGGVSLASNASNGTWNFGSSSNQADRAVGGLSTTVANATRCVSVMTQLSNEDANMLSCVSWVFVVVTTFIISFFVDKVAHRFFYVFGLAAALTAWILIIGGGVSTIAGIWLFTILWGVNNGSSVQVFYALWGSELFPAKFRAGAQGFMFFVVRGLSAVWGLVFTFIYGDNGEGFTLAAYCMVALLLTALVVGLIGMPNTRGKSLDQITKERYGENY